jgi:hypothetical protein
MTASGCGREKPKIYASTVEKDIHDHLAVGSSKADVIAFLDSRKIYHYWLRKPEGWQNGRDVIPNSHIEEGVIRDARMNGWGWNSTDTSIYIDFKFDNADSNLVSYSVFEIYKGL